MINKCNFSSIISPKLLHNKLQEKDQSFQYFFSNPCSLITNHIQLPTRPNYLTNRLLTATSFSAKNTGKIIPSLEPNKAQCHDGCMLCGDPVNKPSEMILLISGLFPSDCKMASIGPIYLTADKKTFKKLLSILLAPYLW